MVTLIKPPYTVVHCTEKQRKITNTAKLSYRPQLLNRNRRQTQTHCSFCWVLCWSWDPCSDLPRYWGQGHQSHRKLHTSQSWRGPRGLWSHGKFFLSVLFCLYRFSLLPEIFCLFRSAVFGSSSADKLSLNFPVCISHRWLSLLPATLKTRDTAWWTSIATRSEPPRSSTATTSISQNHSTKRERWSSLQKTPTIFRTLRVWDTLL